MTEISTLEAKIRRLNPLRITPEFGYAHHFSKKSACEIYMLIHENKLYQVNLYTSNGKFTFTLNPIVIYGKDNEVKYTKVVFNQMYGYKFD